MVLIVTPAIFLFTASHCAVTCASSATLIVAPRTAGTFLYPVPKLATETSAISPTAFTPDVVYDILPVPYHLGKISIEYTNCVGVTYTT